MFQMNCGRRHAEKIQIPHGTQALYFTIYALQRFYSFVPVFATGFDDLRTRVDAQSVQSEKLKQRLTVRLLPLVVLFIFILKPSFFLSGREKAP